MNALWWTVPAIPAGLIMYDQIYRRVRQWRMDDIKEKRAALRALRRLTPNELGQLGMILHPDNGKGITTQNLDDNTIADRHGLVSRDDLAFRVHHMERMLYAIASGNGTSRDDLAMLAENVGDPAPTLRSSTLSELFEKYDHQPSLRKVLIGETIDETTKQIVPLTLDIPSSVHGIITGGSGLGKSTLMEAIAMQLVGLQDVSVAAIDYGSGTFDGVEDHLDWQLADSPEMAIALMIEIVKEIKRRQAAYKNVARARSLQQYNMFAERMGIETFPFVVLMIDETSPLLDEEGTKKQVVELARTGRKFGIGLIFGGTDFKADTMPTEARGNCQARMSFWLETGLSRSLFNNTEANKLSGKGDILIQRAGHTGLVRGRTPLVVDADYRLLGNSKDDQQEIVPVRDPNPTVDVSDDQIASSLRAMAVGNGRFSRAKVEQSLFGYTGGRAHKAVKRVAEAMHGELEALMK